jgi:hypothetical protein
MEAQDQLDHLVLQVLLGKQDYLVSQVVRGLLDHLVFWDHQEQLDSQAYQDQLVIQD